MQELMFHARNFVLALLKVSVCLWIYKGGGGWRGEWYSSRLETCVVSILKALTN